MKRNYNKSQKASYQAREREFDEMSSRLMNEFRNERKNSKPFNGNGNNRYNNNHHNDDTRRFNNRKYENRNEETKTGEQTEFTGPVSHTNDFVETVVSITNKCKELVDTKECGIKIYEGRKKEESGAVFVKVTITNLTSDDQLSETLMFYFTEDHSINPKKKNYVKNYMENILIINQKSGNILFNKFGYQITEKASAYIEKMIQKNIELVVGKPIMETVSEEIPCGPGPDYIPETTEEK